MERSENLYHYEKEKEEEASKISNYYEGQEIIYRNFQNHQENRNRAFEKLQKAKMCIFLPLSRYPLPGIYTSVKGTKPKEVIEFWKNEWAGRGMRKESY